MRMVRIVAWCAVVAGLIYLSGCAESPQPPPPAEPAQALKELGEVYKYLDYSKFPPPKNAAEFNQYQDAMMNAYQGVQNGDYVVAYGVGWSTAPGASSQVLAYEKKVPTDGGAVLLRDGTVKQMTAAEFAVLPKAK
jgi:hypothetical protein